MNEEHSHLDKLDRSDMAALRAGADEGLSLSELTASMSTCTMSDPGEDPTYDDDPMPLVTGVSSEYRAVQNADTW